MKSKNALRNAMLAASAALGVTVAGGNAFAMLPKASGSSATAPSAPASPATGAETGATEGTTTGSTASATYSDTEVEQFAKAVLAVQQIQNDTTASPADKQTKMAAAVQQSGLTPTKFNEIAKASSSDPALMQRVQAAAGKVKGSSAPAG